MRNSDLHILFGTFLVGKLSIDPNSSFPVEAAKKWTLNLNVTNSVIGQKCIL
jgi:hypothetical protein